MDESEMQNIHISRAHTHSIFILLDLIHNNKVMQYVAFQFNRTRSSYLRRRMYESKCVLYAIYDGKSLNRLNTFVVFARTYSMPCHIYHVHTVQTRTHIISRGRGRERESQKRMRYVHKVYMFKSFSNAKCEKYMYQPMKKTAAEQKH